MDHRLCHDLIGQRVDGGEAVGILLPHIDAGAGARGPDPMRRLVDEDRRDMLELVGAEDLDLVEGRQSPQTVGHRPCGKPSASCVSVGLTRLVVSLHVADIGCLVQRSERACVPAIQIELAQCNPERMTSELVGWNRKRIRLSAGLDPSGEA